MTVHYLNRVNAPEATIVSHKVADHRITPRARNPLSRLLCRLGLHSAYVCRAWHTLSHRGAAVIAREYRCARCGAGWTMASVTKRV